MCPPQDEHQDENGLVVLASSSIAILNGQPSTLSPCPGSQARALALSVLAPYGLYTLSLVGAKLPFARVKGVDPSVPVSHA
jgi:hypothetical protein